MIRTWAGVRPLIDTRTRNTGARRVRPGGPSDISRAHQIRMPEPGWFDVAGGKLTTYRRIAQQVVDRIVRYQGRKAEPCRTAIEPLLMPGQAETPQRHSSPAGSCRPGRALLPPRMGRASRRRDDPSHELALLSCRRREDCRRSRRLDGRACSVGTRPGRRRKWSRYSDGKVARHTSERRPCRRSRHRSWTRSMSASIATCLAAP